MLCNDLSTAFQGFNFDSPHTGTNIWKGNKMQTLARGFCLSNNGQIGQQGSNGNPIDNQWNGSWTGMSHTDVDATSNGTNSKFYTKAGGVWQPINNTGFFGANYSTAGYVNITTGSYSCGGGGGGARMMSTGNEESEENPQDNFSMRLINSTELSDLEYIKATADYRFLMENDSIRQSDTSFQIFCDALAGTSLEAFYLADQKLRSNEFSNAKSLSESVNCSNTVELKYKQFYHLNNKYHSNTFNKTDSTELHELADRCPGIHGEAVYYARSLFNLIYSDVFKFNEVCADNSGARITNLHHQNINAWNVQIIPNPVSNCAGIISTEDGLYTYVLKDLTGKIVMSGNLVVHEKIANLNLNLNNGVYLITLTGTNGSTTKKIIVSK